MRNIKNQVSKVKKEEGITLLMSVLIMAVISIIAITVSFFALQESRASRAAIYTEPAIVAAESVGERGVWSLKRNLGTLTACDFGSSKVSINSNVKTEYCRYDASANWDVQKGDPLKFYLYDSTDMMDLTPGYNYIVISNNSNKYTIGVEFFTLTGQLFHADTLGFLEQNVQIPRSGANLQTLDPVSNTDERYRVVITATNANPTDIGKANVVVNSYGAGGVSKGIPDFPTIDAQGCSSVQAIAGNTCANISEGYIRKINITVPQ